MMIDPHIAYMVVGSIIALQGWILKELIALKIAVAKLTDDKHSHHKH